jgi:hypothetical protein
MVRFGLTIAEVVNQEKDQIAILALASCLMLDSFAQLGYWIYKKQTMPEIVSNEQFRFDEFKNNNTTQIMLNRQDIEQKISQKTIEDNFPYIKSTVKIENSKFKIILEILVSNNILPEIVQEEDTTGMSIKAAANRSSHDENLAPMSLPKDKSHSSSQIR